MSLKAGIVGLPNVGKSTLFNAITKQNILAANYPFATIEPNVGTVIVPDARVDYLTSLYNPKRSIPTTFEFTDIAGLVQGASSGEGLGNKFLSHIREVDAIVEVVRCFIDPNITHVTGKVDPVSDIEIINIELVLADLEVVNNRLGKVEKKAEATKDKLLMAEVEVLNKCKNNLEANIPLRRISFSEDELKLLKNFNFLTIKPIIYVANVSEDDIAVGDNEYSLAVKNYAEAEGSGVIVMCTKLEADLAGLEDEERIEFLESVGIKNSGLDKLIFASYNLLGLKTFFTVGADEVRAWTFRSGSKAPVCAGIIHSDFERGFIRAEVMSYDDLVEYGTELKVKEAGKLRIEGKDYVMQDGDICYFRFNV
ncbi:MAG TPA: redox-regulated ATPase YchF [Candidatus Onthocola stercorigallinarum]|nr:redox-regulated ATPase YchF [Candidatus Onthocola stercorigallinarum]